MPSSHGRSIVAAVFVFALAVSAYAHAQGANPFPQNLQLRDTGPEVAALQKFLNAQSFVVAQTGPGSPGRETSTFGLLTYRALVRYQKAHGLPATGFFGPLTRAAFMATAGSAPSNTSSRSSGAPQQSGPSSTEIPATSSQPLIPLSFPTVSLTFGGGGEGGGGGVTSSNTVTPTPDTTPPVISAIATSSSGFSTSTISWTTDEPATSEVVYGLTTSYGSASSSATLTTSHSIQLSGLYSGSTYHFAVVSADSSGNTATSSDETLTTATATPIVVYLTSTTTTTWAVPNNWSSYNNIQTIGGGGSGGAAGEFNGASGGGGGAWAETFGLSLTPGSSVGYQVGADGAAVAATDHDTVDGNAGGNTWFCNSTSNCRALASSSVEVGSQGGGAGGAGSLYDLTGGSGGLTSTSSEATVSVGLLASGGGSGGSDTDSDNLFTTGGGGAGGPNGNGNNGANNPGSIAASAGGAGDAGAGGAGGTGVVYNNGGNGGNGVEWDSSHGSGGGGGGGFSYDSTQYNTGAGGNGGLYGGGGGGYAYEAGGTVSGAGSQGIIAIKYLPEGANPVPPSAPVSLTLSNTTQTTADVRWSSGGGTTDFYYVAAGTGSTPSCSSGTLVDGTSFTLSGLYVGENYTVAVCAVDQYGTMSAPATANTTTLTYSDAGSPPAVAAAAGYNVATFYDDFSTSSDIDLNNTGDM
jgi:hypothetical protein